GSAANLQRAVYRISARWKTKRRLRNFPTFLSAGLGVVFTLPRTQHYAAPRIPDLGSLENETKAPTLSESAERWFASRVDVAPNTKLQHRSAMRNLLAVLGAERVDQITPNDVADLVPKLSE